MLHFSRGERTGMLNKFHNLHGKYEDISDEELKVERDQSNRAQFLADVSLTKEQAAEQGQIDSQRELAVAYVSDDPGVRDSDRALEWGLRTAKSSDIEAQCNLGLIYTSAPSRIQDFSVAKQWFQQSAEAGFAPAQYSLSRIIDRKFSSANSALESNKWLRMAADQGYSKACYRLGLAYDSRHGLDSDQSIAMSWTKR